MPPSPSSCRVRAAVVGVALVGAALPAVAPAHAAQAGDPGVTSVTTALTQPLSSATVYPMNQPVQGSTGRSGWFKHSSPTVGDLDPARPGKEVVIGSLDGNVYAYDAQLRPLPGWPIPMNAPDAQAGPVSGTPALGDVDGDGRLEVVAGSDNGWVFARNADGSLVPGWPRFTGWNADYPSRCATDACTGVYGGPTVADVDGDGRAEVVAGSFSHPIFLWRGDGSEYPGWEGGKDVWDGVPGSAAVGDLNGDGRPEIVIGSDVANDCPLGCPPYGQLRKGGLVHAFQLDGSQLPGWPVAVDSFQSASPALVDIDRNGTLEVITGGGFFTQDITTRGHSVRAWNHLGHLLWEYRAAGIVNGSPVVGDVRGDGSRSVVFGDVGCSGCSPAGWVYELDLSGRLRWKSQGVDSTWAPQGYGGMFGGPVLADVSGDGVADIVTADGNWHVRAFSPKTGSFVLQTGGGWSFANSPAVADLDGDGRNEVVAGAAENAGPADGSGAGRRGELFRIGTNGTGGLQWPQFHSRVVLPPPPACLTGTAARGSSDLPAIRRGGRFYLRNSLSSGAADLCFDLGLPTDQPVFGDWDGNGSRTPGVYRASTGTFYLSNASDGRSVDLVFALGMPGDKPVVGDWDGNGSDTIGVFRDSTGTWYLTNDNRSGVAQMTYKYAVPHDVPAAGDWDGNGTTTLGIFRPSTGTWYLTNHNDSGVAQKEHKYAVPGDQPVVGDFDGNGTTTLGVFRPGTGRWYLTNDNDSGIAQTDFQYGSPGDQPMTWS